MDWWMALLVASVPVLITSVSLIAQQAFNSKAAERSERLRVADTASERAHQERLQQIEYANERERADEDHRRQVRDSWKADRRDAHTRLLSNLSEIDTAATSFLTSVTLAVTVDNLPSDASFTPTRLRPELVADVELICSDDSAAAARRADTAVVIVLGAMILLDMQQKRMTKQALLPEIEKAENLLADLKRKISNYRGEAKEDIDTVN